jgi:ferritin
MINQILQKGLNDQINEDQFCSRLYGAMAAYCERVTLRGFAKWFRDRSRERQKRVEGTTRYLLKQHGELHFESLDAPETSWDSLLAVLESAQKREQYLSKRLGKLVDLAQTEGDHATAHRLQKMISEQVDKEVLTEKLVAQVRFAGDSRAGLFLLDRNLG